MGRFEFYTSSQPISGPISGNDTLYNVAKGAARDW
jgi:hypothetical protein